MPKNSCIMQIWAESRKSALPICNYSQILYQFLMFTQNLKRSQKICISIYKNMHIAGKTYSRYACFLFWRVNYLETLSISFNIVPMESI